LIERDRDAIEWYGGNRVEELNLKIREPTATAEEPGDGWLRDGFSKDKRERMKALVRVLSLAAKKSFKIVQ
jgi:hypothetical protein